MKAFQYAITAVMLTLCAAGARADELAAPMRVQFRLTDGVSVNGDMTSWDREGIDGTFGRRAWNAIAAEDVWRVYRKVMAQDSAPQWVDLGRALMLHADQSRSTQQNIQQAFRKARELDPKGARALIEEAQREAAAAKQAANEAAREAEARRLSTRSPEGANYSASPWPALTAEERAAALVAAKVRAERILAEQGLTFAATETPYYVIYTDLGRVETAAIAADLDRAYEACAEFMGLPKGANVYAGKAIVLVFSDADRFRLVETAAFGHLTSRATTAVCHPASEDPACVFVCATHPATEAGKATQAAREPEAKPASTEPEGQKSTDGRAGGEPAVYEPGAGAGTDVKPRTSEALDPRACKAAIVRESVHGFLHRYKSAKRLPAWANEGFAWAVADRTMKDPPVDELLRKHALAAIRGGLPVEAVFNATYDDLSAMALPGMPTGGNVPDDEAAREAARRAAVAGNVAGVGYLAVSLMLDEQPRGFVAFLDAVKAGREWPEALAQGFGTSRGKLAEIVERYYRVNE